MTENDVVQEITRLHRSLPDRPGIEEVEAARTLIRNVENEAQARLMAVQRRIKGKDVPEELFKILQEMQRSMIHFLSKEQKREALKILDLEGAHMVFDDLIQRASGCLSGSSGPEEPGDIKASFDSSNSLTSTVNTSTTAASASSSSPSSSFLNDKEHARYSAPSFSKDDSYVKKETTIFCMNGLEVGAQSVDASSTKNPSLTRPITTSDGGKLSLIKLASLIEVSAKKGTQSLTLQGKLSDQVEWLPDSIMKLTNLIMLDLSENRISVMPDAVGALLSLQTLDLHGNMITELPESIGNLLTLTCLDLRGNQLNSLPPAIAGLVNLRELNLSSNGLVSLPEAIGSLVSLEKLIVETNNIEEIPYTIARCASLKELRADYNRLKALPEAVGRIESLEILTVRYNNVRQLPTTMSSMTRLKELDVSFNELESIPESLCFATSLAKMNISNNFADLRSLPRSIGNLEMLEVLDMSNNQIRVLPESFRMLTQLRVLNVEGNPLEAPMRNVIEGGPQAVVQYMAELVDKKQVKTQPAKQKKSWGICFFSISNKRKRDGVDYSNAS